VDPKISNADFARRRRMAREGLIECNAVGCTVLVRTDQVTAEGLCAKCLETADLRRKREEHEAGVRARAALLVDLRKKSLSELSRDGLITIAIDESAVPSLDHDILKERYTDDQLRGAIETRRRLNEELVRQRVVKQQREREVEDAIAKARIEGDESQRQAMISEAFQRAMAGEDVAIITSTHQRAALIWRELREAIEGIEVTHKGQHSVQINAGGGSIRLINRGGGAEHLRSRLLGFRGAPIIDPACDLNQAEYDAVRCWVKDSSALRRVFDGRR
jgi:hypothetical protein